MAHTHKIKYLIKNNFKNNPINFKISLLKFCEDMKRKKEGNRQLVL